MIMWRPRHVTATRRIFDVSGLDAAPQNRSAAATAPAAGRTEGPLTSGHAAQPQTITSSDHTTTRSGQLRRTVITVSRVAGELAAKFNPDGQRFFVKQYPKDTEWRAVTLSEHMFDQLAEHARGLKPDDLLFRRSMPRRL